LSRNIKSGAAVPYSAVWVLILHFACRHFAGTFSKKICGPRHKNKLSTPAYTARQFTRNLDTKEYAYVNMADKRQNQSEQNSICKLSKAN
jgi:hypothetical protein